MSAHAKGLITVLVCAAVFALLSIPLILRRIPRNRVYGYRSRRTLGDDASWYLVNEYFARRLLVASVASAGIAAGLHAWGGLGPETYRKASVALIAAPAVVAWLLTVRFLRMGGADGNGAGPKDGSGAPPGSSARKGLR